MRKVLSRRLRRASHARLDVPFRLINECADPDNGQRDAARNQIPSPSDTSYARLPLRRLGGVLARRLDPGPAVLPRDGGEDQTLICGHAPPTSTSAAPAANSGMPPMAIDADWTATSIRAGRQGHMNCRLRNCEFSVRCPTAGS